MHISSIQALLDAKHHRTTADLMLPGYGLVALAGERIQQERGPLAAALFLRSRLADGRQCAQFLLGKLQGLALLREGHDPLKHIWRLMYRYLENAHLGTRAGLGLAWG